MSRTLRRAAMLIIFVAFAMGIGPSTLKAQQDNDINILNQQISRLYQAGEYREATDIAGRALALAERQFPEYPTVVIQLGILAKVYQVQRRYADAEPLYKRAIATAEMAFVLTPNRVVVTLTNLSRNLADLYRHQGRCAEAQTL